MELELLSGVSVLHKGKSGVELLFFWHICCLRTVCRLFSVNEQKHVPAGVFGHILHQFRPLQESAVLVVCPPRLSSGSDGRDQHSFEAFTETNLN